MTSTPTTTMGGTFVWRGPGRVHWGIGTVARALHAELDRHQARRVLLMTTRSVHAEPGLGGALRNLLGERLAMTVSDVREHTPLDTVAAAARAAANGEIDAVVSLGGGSAIDAGKLVVFAVASGRDVQDPGFAHRPAEAALGRVLPHLAVPTTLSVAELSPSAGFTNVEQRKQGVWHPRLVPEAVLYDATYGVHTPLRLWLSTGIRAVDHAVEGLLAAGEHPLSDPLALEGLRRLGRALRATHAMPEAEAPRSEAQVGAWLAYTLPLEAQVGLSHALGKRFGATWGIPHGITSCIMLAPSLRVREARPERSGQAEMLARIADALEPGRALPASEAVARLVADLGLATRLSDHGVTAADIETVAADFRHPDATSDEIRAILTETF